MKLFKKEKEEVLVAPEEPTQIVETGKNFRVPVPTETPVQQTAPVAEPLPKVFNDFIQKYQGSYVASDFAKSAQDSSAFYAEVCTLLFAMQNEMREIKEVLQTLK
jgi:hypothetical protein